MTSHPDIDHAAAERLRLALTNDSPGGDTEGGDDPTDPPGASGAPAPPARAPRAGAAARLRRVLAPRAKRLLRPVLSPVIERLRAFVRFNAGQVSADLLAAERQRGDRLEAELAVTRAELAGLVPAASALAGVADTAALVREGVMTADEARATRINSELLKAELARVHDTLEQLGRAIAPDAGLDAAAERLAEVRERLDALDRRVRRLAAAPPTPAEAGDGPPATPPGPAVDDGFDYVGFERRFRGDASSILSTLIERYGERLAAHQPVLDVGCGRGELLAALAERGVEGSGVDLDAGMADEAAARGVDVTVGDAVAHLASLPDGSLGSIVSIHVVEHLPLAALTRMLELAAQKLRPGGVLVMETPNPASLIVLGNSYILDPTHEWPLHPSLLAFLCERAGFRGLEFEWWSPATDYHLPLIDGDHGPWVATVNAAFEQLNKVLFGPQEYAIVATTPGAPVSGG